VGLSSSAQAKGMCWLEGFGRSSSAIVIVRIEQEKVSHTDESDQVHPGRVLPTRSARLSSYFLWFSWSS